MRRRIDLLVSLLVLVAMLALRYQDGPFVIGVRNILFDSYQRLDPRPYDPSVQVRIFAIDEDSLKHLGQWPWPRDTLARIVGRLTADGALAIALDVLLAEPDRTGPQALLKQWQGRPDIAALSDAVAKLPDPDAELAKELTIAPAVLAFALNDQPGGQTPAVKAGIAMAGDDALPWLLSPPGATTALPELEKATPGYGSVTVPPDRDGIVRKVPLLFAFRGQIYPSLVAEALRIAQPGASTYIVKASNASGETALGAHTGLNNVKVGGAIVPVDSHGNVLLYDSGFQPKRFVSLWRVLEPDFDANLVRGNVILIGSTVEGLRDFKPTPLDPRASGIETHAQILEQILNHQYLQRPDWADGAEMLFLLVFGLALILLLHPLGALWAAVVTVIAIAASFAFSWFSFQREGLLLDPLYPGLAAFAVYLTGSLLGYLRSESERRHVRRSFSMYLAPAVVEELSRHPERLKLGGELRDLTVMFSDIRDFTRISEQLDPHALTHMLNSVLTPLTTAIQDRKGLIDKYIGDCIMAFWNAPLDDSEHARNALKSALAMQKALAQANATLAEEARKAGRKVIDIGIGIGINRGPCSVGNMGSVQRMAYSALGDTVNLASRLESLTRSYGVEIIVGEDVAEGIADMALLEIDRVQVKGRTQPLTIHTLLAESRDAAFEALASAQAKFLEAYRRQDWSAAREAIAACLGLAPRLKGLYDLYAGRIEDYEAEPPDADWDGVFIAKSKTG